MSRARRASSARIVSWALPFECQTVALLNISAGQSIVLPYSPNYWETGVDPSSRESCMAKARLHKITPEGAQMNTGGQSFVLKSWKTLVKSEPKWSKTKEGDVSSGAQDVDVWIRVSAVYQCLIIPPSSSATSYSEFYLKVDDLNRPPFEGMRKLIFSCRIEPVAGSPGTQLIRAVDHSEPFDRSGVHYHQRADHKELVSLHHHAAQLKMEGSAAHTVDLLRSKGEGADPTPPPSSSTSRTTPNGNLRPEALVCDPSSGEGPASPGLNLVTITGTFSPNASSEMPQQAYPPNRLAAPAIETLEAQYSISGRPQSWWVGFFEGLAQDYPEAAAALLTVAEERISDGSP